MPKHAPLHIQYRFQWPEGEEFLYTVSLDGDHLNLLPTDKVPGDAPAWTALDFYQCPHCPLDPATTRHCPLALNIAAINQRFAHHDSHERVHLEVTTEERTLVKEVSLQQAIGSLMGLVIPCSGCPHTRYFRPMARFHLPFSSEQETIYRASSMFLLAQYFMNKAGGGGTLELDGLNDIYQNLHTVNTYCAKRLRDSASSDSTINAVVLLDTFAVTLPYAIEESLEELAYLFTHFD